MQAGRELDAAIAAALGFTVEWRWCSRDPECGGWGEVQGMDEEGEHDYAAKPDWYSQQPCYNWLDTDGPKENGWTAEQIATAESRGAYWRVVSHYSTDIAAAWLVWQAVKTLDRHKGARFWSALRSLVQMRLDSEHLLNDAAAALYMEPEDICKAMLEAHGMRMLPDWYY